jgi:hypothetical protein
MARPRIMKTHREKTLEAMEEALLVRAGLRRPDYKNPFAGSTLMEMGREILKQDRALPREGNRMDLAGAMLASAANHNSGDFPHLLKNVAHKALLLGWAEAEETFDRWTRAGSLRDFKEAHRVALNAFPTLREVPEGHEYRYVSLGDTGETIKLATYGELLSITRQALVSDDTRSFTTLPKNMGLAARATIAGLVISTLTDGQVMAETGKQLFHVDHGNLSDLPLGEAGLIQATTDFRKHRDPGGNARLTLRPRFLIVPAALEFEARRWMASPAKPGAANDEVNPFVGLAEVIVDARLDDASSSAWYMAAAPNAIDTIEVAYLDGREEPYLEEMPGWDVDGISYKVRIDAGVKALGYRGLWKSTGTAA